MRRSALIVPMVLLAAPAAAQAPPPRAVRTQRAQAVLQRAWLRERLDVPLLAGTWFSTQLPATSAVPEWDGQRVRTLPEAEAALTPDGRMAWVRERQTAFPLVH